MNCNQRRLIKLLAKLDQRTAELQEIADDEEMPEELRGKALKLLIGDVGVIRAAEKLLAEK